MPAGLLYREQERRLAGPTEALTAGPDSLRTSFSFDDPSAVTPDGVTAVLDQATALVERNPQSPTARARLAHAQLAAARPSDARRTAHVVLNDDNAIDDPPSLVSAAVVLAAVGDSEGAETALSLLGGRSFPHLFAQLAIERNEWETALSRLEGFTDSVSVGLRGWIQLQGHRYRDAVRSFRAVIAAGPASPDLYLNLGYAYGALGSLPKAIRATKTALGLAPASRTAGFNLAAFYCAAGDKDSALSALASIRGHHPNELAPRLASASAYARFGDLDGAERELRRAAAERPGWAADAIERATLKANLVALRHAQGRLTADDAYTQVRIIVEQLDYRDLGIAHLLLGWMTSTRQADDADELARELGRRHPPRRLGAFRSRVAFLRGNYDTAIEEARRWMIDEPFDGAAVTMLTYLLIETQEAFSEAAQVGKAALQRMPSETVIRNNVAYALTLMDQPEAAAKVLGSLNDGNEPLSMATAGLIRIRLGRVDEGLAMYERAARIAEKAHLAELAVLIRHRASIEAALVGRDVVFDTDDLADKYKTDPRFILNALRSGSP